MLATIAVFVCISSIGVAHAQWRVSSVPDSTQAATLTYSQTWTGSTSKPVQFEFYAPVPPDIAGQSNAKLAVNVVGAVNSCSSQMVTELSSQHREVERTLVNSSSTFRVTWTYSALLTNLSIERGSAANALISLSDLDQCKQAEQATARTFDNLNSSQFHNWMAENHLIRAATESVTDYEWNVYKTLGTNIEYVYIPGQDHKVSLLTAMNPIRTDCGGYCTLCVASSLANGIAARLRPGRWLQPGTTDDGYEHVQYDFFDPQSQQWWIADPTVGGGLPNKQSIQHFVNWSGRFMTMSIGCDLDVPKLNGTNYMLVWPQGVVYWYHGLGFRKTDGMWRSTLTHI